MPMCILYSDALEADDVIAYCNKHYKLVHDDKINEIEIISTDKDFYQLIDDKTKVFNTHLRKVIDKTFVMEKYNILCDNWIYLKAVTGDISDGIEKLTNDKGKGITSKTFSKYLPAVSDTVFNTVDSFIDYFVGQSTTVKQLQGLCNEQNMDKLRNNYKIMNLDNMYMITADNMMTLDKQMGNFRPDFSVLDFDITLSKMDIPTGGITDTQMSSMMNLLRVKSKQFMEKVWGVTGVMDSESWGGMM
jgi:5'-3' exonuclease